MKLVYRYRYTENEPRKDIYGHIVCTATCDSPFGFINLSVEYKNISVFQAAKLFETNLRELGLNFEWNVSVITF